MPPTPAGHQRGDIDAHVGEDRQQDNRPDKYPQHNAKDHHGDRVAYVRWVAQHIAQPEAHAAVEPERELKNQRDKPAVIDGAAPWRANR